MKRLLLVPLAAIALVACNPLDSDSTPFAADEQQEPVSATPVTKTPDTASTTVPSAPTATPETRAEEHGAGRAGAPATAGARAQTVRDEAKVGGPNRPVEKAATNSQPATLKQIAIRGEESAQAMTFEFAGPVPGYRVEYAANPTQCGSRKPLPLPVGASALVLRFEPATAHDTNGKLTIANTVIESNGPHVLGATQICDFEGVVSWAIAVAEKGPFAVTDSNGRLSVVVGAK